MINATETDLASMVAAAVASCVREIERRLVEVQAELDDIGPTFGMAARRAALKREKNELLDQLLAVRAAA